MLLKKSVMFNFAFLFKMFLLTNTSSFAFDSGKAKVKTVHSEFLIQKFLQDYIRPRVTSEMNLEEFVSSENPNYRLPSPGEILIWNYSGSETKATKIWKSASQIADVFQIVNFGSRFIGLPNYQSTKFRLRREQNFSELIVLDGYCSAFYRYEGADSNNLRFWSAIYVDSVGDEKFKKNCLSLIFNEFKYYINNVKLSVQ